MFRSWARTAEEVRRILRLKEVVLSCLRQDGWAGFVYEHTDSCIEEVEAFFLRQGANPFTTQAIRQKVALYGIVGLPDPGHARGHWCLERHWRRVMG